MKEVQVTTAKYGVAVVPEGLPLTQEEYMQQLAENLQGEGKLPTLKILHGGATAWSLRDSQGNKTREESLTGVILLWYKTNTFWKDDFATAGGGKPPDCFAFRGVEPSQRDPRKVEDVYPNAPASIAHKRVFSDCQRCYFNDWGSVIARPKGEGRGKACGNRARLFVMRPGELIPSMVIIAPSSLGSLQSYMIWLTQQGKVGWTVETNLGLLEKDSEKGVHSILDPSFARELTPDEIGRMKQIRDQYLEFMIRKPISVEEMEGEEEE